jgi:hypothetical protein
MELISNGFFPVTNEVNWDEQGLWRATGEIPGWWVGFSSRTLHKRHTCSSLGSQGQAQGLAVMDDFN